MIAMANRDWQGTMQEEVSAPVRGVPVTEIFVCQELLFFMFEKIIWVQKWDHIYNIVF